MNRRTSARRMAGREDVKRGLSLRRENTCHRPQDLMLVGSGGKFTAEKGCAFRELDNFFPERREEEMLEERVFFTQRSLWYMKEFVVGGARASKIFEEEWCQEKK